MAEEALKGLGVGKRMPDDQLFATGDALCRMYVREGIVDIDDEQLCHEIVAAFPCRVAQCRESFSSLLEFEMHFNSCHRFICGQCRKQLPSAHFLDLHLSETHDSFFAAQAEQKPMYRCFVEECPLISQNEAQRKFHCIEDHSFPANFRYDQSRRKNKNSIYQGSSSKTVSDIDTMMTDVVQEKNPQTVKHFTFGHQKQARTFSKNKKRINRSNSQKKPSDDSTSELMDTLPP